MNELSIKVNIANREYPLTVKSEEAESVKKAAMAVNERVKEFEKSYSVKDKQDLLAMCALQFATLSAAVEGKVTIERPLANRIIEVERFVSEYLKKG
jgi:cell division protein ZapA (FtsZ GTPase activity inhibitor)